MTMMIRMREELLRRGAIRPGMPGLPPHDPYLEASRRYAQAAGLPSPYNSEFFKSKIYHNLTKLFQSMIVWLLRG